MRTKTSKLSQLKTLGGFVGLIATAIVSGLPREKVFLNPGNKTNVLTKNGSFKPDREKHYHRPIAKPTVEKQTLLKEKKKVKASLI